MKATPNRQHATKPRYKYHLCPRCVAEHPARYREGNFETPLKQPVVELPAPA
jgi:hypothetical protein